MADEGSIIRSDDGETLLVAVRAAVATKTWFRLVVGDLEETLCCYSAAQKLWHCNEHANPSDTRTDAEVLEMAAESVVWGPWGRSDDDPAEQGYPRKGWGAVVPVAMAAKAYREDAYVEAVAADYGEPPEVDWASEATDGPGSATYAWHEKVDRALEAQVARWVAAMAE
jgi:hypothetical protein